jgi:VWFA-related protein
MKSRFLARCLLLISVGLLAIAQLPAQNENNKDLPTGQATAVPATQPVQESSIMSGSGQKPEATFSSHSELVLVPVLVSDRSGKHLPGLKKENFTIKQDGKIQQIKFFEEITAEPAPLPATPAGKPSEAARTVSAGSKTYSNAVEEKVPVRIVIILFDMLNSHFKDQVPARRQIVKYLKEDVEPGTLVCLMGLGRGGLRMYHDLTTDTKGLGTALELKAEGGRHAISGTLNIGDSDEQTPESASSQTFVGHGQFALTGSSGRKDRKFIIINTLEAFRNIAGAYAGVPGRKSLIWVTGGFPFSIDGYKTGSMPGLDKDSLLDMLPDYERTWQVLNNANVALYPVDMHGLVNTSSADATHTMRRGGNPTQQLANYGKDRQDKNADNLGTMQTFASMTGGKAFYNNNDLIAGFREAEADSRSSYLLGYYLQKDEKPGWHKIHVDVAQPGVHVRARSGYFMARHDRSQPDVKDAKDLDVQLAMTSPMNFTGVPITVKWLGVLPDPKAASSGAAEQKSGKRTIGFQISLPSHTATIDQADNNHVSLNFIALARTQTADDAADFVKKIEGQLKPEIAKRMQEAGIKFDSTIQVLPGKYNVRFVVRDNLSGRIGSVTAPLTVK